MQKVDGVETIRVSLNDGLTILDLKPGNTVTLANLRQIIKNNGFVSKEAQVVARGTAGTVDGKPVFEVSGTRERFVTASPPQRSGDDWRFAVPAPSK
jgi:hypothetical protein